ncbi:WD40 repeat-like protein, partial [Fomitiporia mediterranea MF3/22]|uniref:WD40 repeat-like protein n=1 Tax=Fomitiporia mediterranea (strain MF3/22) TaxID=694068 RepID=UPI0004409A1C
MKMAERCLDIMASGLKFNICNLESSHLPNDEVHDLAERICKHIPHELQYRCMYWLNHLSRSYADAACERLMQQKLLSVFCDTASLYWLEALSLMSQLKAAVSIRRDLPRLPKYSEMDEELRKATEDLYRFVMAYHEPMAISAPHIYISALLWASSESIIAKSHYQRFASGHLVLEGLGNCWPVTLRTLSVGSWVKSAAYSPDGRYIVSGSSDYTIRIWDAKTGAPIGKPLRGHEDPVNSVGYSQDGRCVASGSNDGTVRIWDAEAGAPIGEPLRGHEGWVSSVGYSPDGHRIVSGYCDKTVRIWEAGTGVPVGEPLRGHKYSVYSVGYSPDGRYIVSGSGDNTIRIWDAELGIPIGEALRGHEYSVNSVSYSPDGRHIVSGSDDNTVRIWDA